MEKRLGIIKRLHQLFCKHEHSTRVFIGEGINNAKGKEFIAYDCMYCGHAEITLEDKK